MFKKIIVERLRENVKSNKKIICKKCSWSWEASESDDDDLYICHKCWTDNTPKPINENPQMAEKFYLKTNKIKLDDFKKIIKITNGDNTTKLICDLFVSNDYYERGDKYKDLIMVHKQLLAYNKNLFPIKDFDIYNKNDNLSFYLFKNRQFILDNIKKLPSVAIRNMRKEIATPRDYTGFLRYKEDLDTFMVYYSMIDNKSDKQRKKIEDKMFKSNITLDELIDFVSEKENLISDAKITRNMVINVVRENSYDLEIVYKNNNVMVIDVTSPQGIKKIGCNSLWCFTYGSGFGDAYRQWNNYSTNDHVYVFIDFKLPSNDPEFMHVMVKPISNETNDGEDDDFYEQDNDSIFNAANEVIYDEHNFIDRMVGLETSKKILTFGEELPEPEKEKEKEKPFVDPNQLSLFERKNIIKQKNHEQLIMENRVKFDLDVPDDILAIKDVFKTNNKKLYIVGGAVRDAILKEKIKDYDLVTDALPDDVESMMNKAGFKTLPTGKAFGVINVFTDKDEYEIATMRSDDSGGRRPNSVTFTNIETDVKRRDLTCNALYYDIDTNEIIDMVGGIDDIKNNVVDTVGNPSDRFNEDPLRIMRYIRFLGRFNSNPNTRIDAALKQNASLEGISGERIRDEFIKGIKTSKSTRHFLQMIDRYNIFNYVFTGLKINKQYIESKDYIIVISGLLKDNDTKVVTKKLNELRYTIDEIKKITFLINLIGLTPETAVMLKRQEKNSGASSQEILLFGRINNLNEKLLNAYVKYNLTVNGNILMDKLGLKPGKELGDAINRAEFDEFRKIFN